MRVTFNINDKHFLFLVGVLAVVSVAGIVTGYNTNDPAVMGHTLDELEPGTFPSGDYVFPNNLNISTNLDVGDDVAVTGDMTANTTHIICPSGFTSVEKRGRQLGCIQNDEQGSKRWENAADDCFDTFGGRLPTNIEWFIAMKNNNLGDDETDDWEWAADHHSDEYHVIVGGRAGTGAKDGINSNDHSEDTTARAYRCWIDR